MRVVIAIEHPISSLFRAKLPVDKIRRIILVDKIMYDWLSTTQREAHLLAEDSDVLKLQATPRPTHSWPLRPASSSSSGSPVDTDDASDSGHQDPVCSHFLARFLSDTYVLPADSQIPQISKNVSFTIGIYFPPDYLRGTANYLKLITLLSPMNFYHPNARAPYLCIGRLEAGTGLVDILYQIHDLITFKNVGVREDDSLNPAACQWFRNPENWDGHPVDDKPLRRRKLNFSLSSSEE